jgi:hypothetical protein
MGAIADRARRTLEWTDRLHSQEHCDCPKLDDISKDLMINTSFNGLMYGMSLNQLKAVDPSLVFDRIQMSFICPVFRETSGDNPWYPWRRGNAKTAQLVGQRNLSDREDSEQVRKRVAAPDYTLLYRHS